MRGFNLKKYNYVVLWLALIAVVVCVWLFGGRAVQTDDAVSSAVTASPSPLPTEPTVTETERELLGVWVPYMSLTTKEHTQSAFEENFRSIADSAKAKGLNALFVHVRPFCDALYKSKYFPWSHILTGEQGTAPGFDPLEFMVDYAHGIGLELHAWINPLRVKTAETPTELSRDNPYVALGEEYPYYFMEYDGVYLNPAYPYVRTLIADGAAEIAQNYDVDGIHLDDYFYPSDDENLDSEAYAAYTQNVEQPLPLSEWRRANISAMVQEMYEKIKAARPMVQFGISPQGNIENDLNMGADVKAWCAVEGYVDYICPQLYYSFENPTLGYGEALAQWLALSRHDNLKLYAGLALYKAGSDADEGTWQFADDNIMRQIEAARSAGLNGIVLYSADYLDHDQTEREIENAMAVLSARQNAQ